MSGAADDDYGIPILGPILPPDQWAKTAVKRLPPPGPVDWQAVFGRTAPLVLDLGCGNGRFVIASALAHAERDHIGIESCRSSSAMRRAAPTSAASRTSALP
jgi:tRNA (guanine-N7-)-methyltransferase